MGIRSSDPSRYGVKVKFKCRVCGHDSYTGPFGTTMYECDGCAAVFGDPRKFSTEPQTETKEESK